MDTVTESAMAVAMASLGGIGILHSNNSPSDQFSLLYSPKSRRIPFISDFEITSSSNFIDSESDFNSSSVILVTENGSRKYRVLGYVLKFDWANLKNRDGRVGDYMSKFEFSVPSSYDMEQIVGFLSGKGVQLVPTVSESDGKVVDLVTMEDVERIWRLPKMGLPFVGPEGEFLVGAAIGTRESDKERLEYLVKGEVDAVVLDSSDMEILFNGDMAYGGSSKYKKIPCKRPYYFSENHVSKFWSERGAFKWIIDGVCNCKKF
ncbi:hypothetical protein Ancab_008343 [Ancistrocladus abbreviatus]